MSDEAMITLPPGFAPSAPSTPVAPREQFVGTPPSAPSMPFVAPSTDPPEPTVAIDDATTVAPPRRSRAKWRLILPTGVEHIVTGTVVVGRQPATSAFAGATDTLTVDDADGLISKSHAVFELDGGDLWVRDLRSTNGVVIVGPDDSERDVTSERSAVADGDEVELGSYAIRVARGGS